MGLQKLMKQPDKMANSMLMSTAHKAAAKLLVIPSMPESLVSLISLMPTKQLNASMGLPFWSTKSAFKNCLEQVQLSRLAMVACELLRKTMQRKVKTTQKLQVMYCNCATQVLLASCVMPGPVMQIPQLFCSDEISLMKLLTVQLRLQVVAARSPQSSSSRLMQSPEKMLKQVLKFLQQLEAVLKLLFSRSNPRSAAYDLVYEYRQLLICEVRVELSARSSVQVMLLSQMAVEQLYLQPFGTWMIWQKRLLADRSKAENLVRETKRELLKQGSTSLRYIDTPTVLKYGKVVYIVFCVKSTLDRIWAYVCCRIKHIAISALRILLILFSVQQMRTEPPSFLQQICSPLTPTIYHPDFPHCLISLTITISLRWICNISCNKIRVMGSQQTQPTYNQEVPNSKQEGFTAVYRKKGMKELKSSPEEEIKTIRDILRVAKNRYGTKDGIGEIIVSKQTGEDGQEVEKRSIRAHTYNQVYDSAYNLGRFLVGKQLFHSEELYGMKLVGIYSKNRYEWFVTDWACILFGLTSVPLYDTLGIENLTFCLNQTLMTTIFVSNGTIKTLLKLQNIGRIKNIISYDPLDQESRSLINKRQINCFDFWEIIKVGAGFKNVNNDAIPIKATDCYTFSYTSGTTGPPKGAMISHRNLTACTNTFVSHQDLKLNADDRYLSYLPLPHLMERSVSLAMFYVGAYVVISSGNMLKLKEDCQTLQVTMFISVPRIFSRIVEGVKNKFANETGVKKCLIDCGVSSKLKNATENGTYDHSFYDSLIFSKVRESFGGKVRILATGSAPLSPQVHAYMKAIMCCPFIEGYGQTESGAGALFSRALDHTYGTLTEISSGLEVKLCDLPEMKYTSKDVNQEGKPTPRGEMWKRGHQIFLGYYKQPDVTSDTLTADGWLKTGDIAELNLDNKGFRIIDRKKNIFKLQQGEYLAPDKIENVYSKCPLVSESFLHGDSHQHFAVVIVTPNREQLEKLAAAKGIPGTFEELCQNPQIRRLALTEMNSVAKREGLHGFETAKNIFLQSKGFLARGILTNTMKLIRFQARLLYKEEIKRMYLQGELPLK